MTHAALKLASPLCVLAATLLFASTSYAQHAYPARGQSPATQAEDEDACSKWATGETGYDPAQPPPVVAAQPAPVTGSGAQNQAMAQQAQGAHASYVQARGACLSGRGYSVK